MIGEIPFKINDLHPICTRFGTSGLGFVPVRPDFRPLRKIEVPRWGGTPPHISLHIGRSLWQKRLKKDFLPKNEAKKNKAIKIAEDIRAMKIDKAQNL